jgi:hypothetical protein
LDDIHKVLVSLHLHAPAEESTNHHQNQIKIVFSNCITEDVIYPLTVEEIAQAQKDNADPKKLQKHDKYSSQLVEDTHLLCKDGNSGHRQSSSEQLAGITILATC